jgi:hypothetical protein
MKEVVEGGNGTWWAVKDEQNLHGRSGESIPTGHSKSKTPMGMRQVLLED